MVGTPAGWSRRVVRKWPFVGRDMMVTHVVRSLTDGETLQLDGDAGIGKSALLDEATARAAAIGIDVVRLAGVETTATMPLTPLLAFAPDGRPPGRAPGALLEGALTEVYRRGSLARLAVVVDDAHLLGEDVAAFVHQVLANRLAVGVLTRRTGEVLLPPLEQLVRRGIATQIEVPLLTHDEVIRAAEVALDGPLEPSAARELDELSGGNPLHLRELVMDALETGALSSTDQGLWRFERRFGIGRRVQELLKDRLATLSVAERDALATAALQAPMPLPVLFQVVGRLVVRKLVDRGLLVIQEDGQRLLAAPAHSLHGTAALNALDPLRRRELLIAASDAWMDTAMRRDVDHAVVAELRLAAGVRPTAQQLLAAVQAPGLLPGRALELADATIGSLDGDGPGRVDAHVARGLALARASRWQEAADAFEQALTLSEGGGRDVALRYLRAALDCDVDPAAVVVLGNRLARHIEGDLEAVVAVETAASFVRPLPESLARITALSEETALPQVLRAKVALLQCTVQSHHGELREAHDAAVALGASGLLDRVDRSRCVSMALESATWLGELDHALTLAGAELATAREMGELDHELRMRHMLQVTLTLAGRIGEAAEHGRRNAHLLSMGLAARGAPAVYPQLALTFSELRNGTHEAEEVVDVARRLPPSALYVWAAEALIAASRLASSDGQRVALLDEAEAISRERGCRIHLARTLHERVRHGIGGSSADELASLGRYMGGITQAWARHARALDSADLDGLSATSHVAERTGLIGLAAESAAQAASAATSAGERGAAAILTARFRRLQETIPETVLAVDEPKLPLTEREQQAITAVLDGSTDATIAASWHVSVRTVHGHLHRTYRKLGIGGRDELHALRARHDATFRG